MRFIRDLAKPNSSPCGRPTVVLRALRLWEASALPTELLPLRSFI